MPDITEEYLHEQNTAENELFVVKSSELELLQELSEKLNWDIFHEFYI